MFYKFVKSHTGLSLTDLQRTVKKDSENLNNFLSILNKIDFKMKKITILMSLMLFSILSASPNQCIDIYNDCYDANPYDPENGVHETMAHIGWNSGCITFLEACFDAN